MRVRKSTVREVGDCNFCARNIGSYGFISTSGTVYELSGGGLLARLCVQCMRTLLANVGRDFMGSRR